MDFRRLDQIPESFFSKSVKMCEDNGTDFFLQPHVFTYDGVEYTISMSKRDMGVLLQNLRYEGAETEGEMNTFYESVKLVDEALRKYPNDDPELHWNDAYARQPGFLIPWEHTDSPVNAISYGFRAGLIETKPMTVEEYRKATFVIIEMIRRMLGESRTQQKLIGCLKDDSGMLRSATVFTYPYVNNRLQFNKLYLTVRKDHALALYWKLGNSHLDCMTWHETDNDLVVRTDLFDREGE